jgi:uncharacterized repeat protein (TIGR01451 family)
MKKQSLSKNLRLLFIAVLVVVFTVNIVPAQTVHARTTSSTSDLAVKVISSPKTAKACQTFKATFSVTNRGPDPATHLYVNTWLPDQLGLVSLDGAPEALAVGQTVTFSARIKVVAFVPGETRQAWVGAYAMSDPYPDVSIDPNSDNDWVSKPLKLTGKPVMVCP